jgi:predicted negative regulator of RcsB-dependent stress response
VALHSDDDELAGLKDWWRRNGKPLLSGSVLALILVLGWQGWQKYQSSQSQGASLLYQQLLETVLSASGEPDVAKVASLVAKLKSDFGGTQYAQYGSLFAAKVAVEAGKLDDAARELRSVFAEPANETLAELSRQRLARVLAAQNQVEDALKLLEGDAEQAYLASREELRGDLLVRLGRGEEAYAAYAKAKDAQVEKAAGDALQMKIDDLAKGDA